MKIIELNREQFLKLLLNPKPYSMGTYGELTLIGNKLYKINYKDFCDAYICKDENMVDEQVENLLELLSEFESINELNDLKKLPDPKIKLEHFSRLLSTKSNDLITGVLSYNNLYVGIEMNYYKDYITLVEASELVSKEEVANYLRISRDLVDDLMEHNIVPKDVQENNILVNIKTGDVKLIDLDDIYTTYGPSDYLKEFPYNYDVIDRMFDEMNYRLKVKEEKKWTIMMLRQIRKNKKAKR